MSLRGTNQELGKPYNRRIVLETIRTSAPISRAGIARKVGLTVQTVSNITRELEQAGLVKGALAPPRGRGQPPRDLTLNPEGGFAIGLHVTPIGIESALIDLAGAVIARRNLESSRSDPDQAFREVGKLTADLRRLRPGDRMLGIGMVIPGPFGVESMSFVGSTTLEGWKGIDIRARLADVAELPAFVEVDVAAAALGERLYGLGKTFREFYYLYFGVGLGGTLVQGAQMLRGANGNAGEIGHLPIVPDGEICPCGNRGCLERYVSVDALRRYLKDADGTGFDAGRRSAATDAWIASAAPMLCTAVVAIENLFDPETIVMGGLAPRDILDGLLAAAAPLRPSVAERGGRSQPRVLVSELGKDAVLRGAAALAVSGVLSPRADQLLIRDDAAMARDPISPMPRERAA